jgi:hypothetical protein
MGVHGIDGFVAIYGQLKGAGSLTFQPFQNTNIVYQADCLILLSPLF